VLCDDTKSRLTPLPAAEKVISPSKNQVAHIQQLPQEMKRDFNGVKGAVTANLDE
jgi:hypothetical protein